VRDYTAMATKAKLPAAERHWLRVLGTLNALKTEKVNVQPSWERHSHSDRSRGWFKRRRSGPGGDSYPTTFSMRRSGNSHITATMTYKT
jgi:hypothetical protein